MMKGQTEIIIILGIIILAAVVMLFATKTIDLAPPPEEVIAAKASLKADLESRIFTNAAEVVKKVGKQGGYLDPTVPVTVSYADSDTAYWQFLNETVLRTRQDVAREISAGLTDVLKNLDETEFSDKTGKDVKISTPRRIDVVIKDHDIELFVHMPVTIDSYALETPFTATVPASYGRAIDFTSNLIRKNIQTRTLETITITSILSYQGNGRDGLPKVPSIGMLTGCGKYMHKEWIDIKPEMETLLRGMLKNTYTAGKVPLGLENTTLFPINVFPEYTDLDVRFELGEELDENSFQMFPNPFNTRTQFMMYVPTCMSPPYRLNYWLFYPVVVEVGESEYKFRSAITVYVDGYEPGKFADVSNFVTQLKREISRCQNPQCDGKIRVEDAEGPLEFARVSYSGCYLGRTDRKGILEGKIPCAISLLDVSKRGHTTHMEMLSSDELADKSVHLHKIPLIKLNLFNVVFTNQSGTLAIEDVVPNDKSAYIGIVQDNLQENLYSNDSFLTTEQIPAGPTGLGYIVTQDIKTYGGFGTNYNFPESDKELWIYAPILKDGFELVVPELKLTPQESGEFSNLLVEGDKAKIDSFLDRLAIREGVDVNEIAQDMDTTVAYISTITALRDSLKECGTQINATLPLSEEAVDINKIKGCA